jgi:molybdenum cofactor cytidylyltransferase
MGAQNKLLLSVNGEMLFVKMLHALQNSNLDELIVVLGHDYKKMIQHCNSNRLKLAINGNHLEGQTTSIKAGLQLVNPSSDAVMICLSDMPLLDETHLNELISSYSYGRILRPMNGKIPGNPSIFPKELFAQIFDCSDTDGCRSVIQKNTKLLDVFETLDPAYFSDIDTPSEYAKFTS